MSYRGLAVEPTWSRSKLIAMENNKYKSGEIVIERVRPCLKLIVNRYVNGIYYCLIQERNSKKELVYFESELVNCSGLDG